MKISNFYILLVPLWLIVASLQHDETLSESATIMGFCSLVAGLIISRKDKSE